MKTFLQTVSEQFAHKPGHREYDDSHLQRYADHIKNDFKKWHGGTVPPHAHREVSFDHGPKYTRVVTHDGVSRSAHSFIDLKGNILKAAGWKVPAKNFSRGHITDIEHKRVTWTGAH